MLTPLIDADRMVGVWLATHLAGPWLDPVMIASTLAGLRGTIWIAFALLVWIVAPTKRMAAWRLLLSIGLAALIGDAVIKPLTGRDRPYVNHPEYRQLLPPPSSSSFPSSHASTAAAGAEAVSRMFPAATLPAAALALLIGTSRITLGVHFPSDVLAGFAIGYLCARFVCARPPKPPLPATRGPVL